MLIPFAGRKRPGPTSTRIESLLFYLRVVAHQLEMPKLLTLVSYHGVTVLK